jgi:FkbM family methyltransferase
MVRYLKRLIKKILPKKLINFLVNKFNFKQNQILKKLEFHNYKNISFLGSNYGGWSFLDNNYLNNKYIISAGLGEDASFDMELISKYNCKILVVDPTPRAIKHYDEIINNQGKAKSKPYAEGGKQSIHSYDISRVNKDNFILINKALYDIDNKELKFFAPPNKKHVSYSLNNWQNNYKETEDYIKVKTITVKSILDKFNIENLEMIKLDIEGAAVEVILDMLEKKIFPNQILVEFDELNKLNDKSIKRFFSVHKKILSNNYKLTKTCSKFPDFLYLKSSI